MLARLTFIALLMISAARAGAGVTLDVELGFGDRMRPGRWNPVFITTSADKPTTTRLDVQLGGWMTVHRVITLNPSHATYTVFIPANDQTSDLKIDLIDVDTNKNLASYPNEHTPNRAYDQDRPVNVFVLTTGRGPAMQGYADSTDSAAASVRHVRPAWLPATPAGYDAVDVLYLNDPDWSGISIEQQRAIFAWINAGGVMVIWPGTQASFVNTPIGAVLPAEVGALRTRTLSGSALEELGLADRFAAMAERPLTPHAHTASVPVAGIGTVIVGRVGFGRVAMLPIDAGSLQFKTREKSLAFWNSLLNPIFGRTAKGETPASYQYGRQFNAVRVALDQIGNLPNVTAFSFWYVLLTVGLLILFVGPIDYYVLKKLHRQPWTWVTTSAFIVLLSTAALYAGRFVQSGQLHFRTLRVLDQADGQIVGQDEVTLLYAPRSENYGLSAPANTWWRPMDQSNITPALSAPQFMQSDRGNVPGPMWIDVWNWAFLIGHSYEPDAPLIEASLRVDDKTIIGTIRNLGDSPMIIDSIVCSGGVAGRLGSVAPHSSIDVHTALDKSTDSHQIFDMAESRTDALNRPALRGFAPTATIYASLQNISADITLDHSEAAVQHTAMLRALVELRP